MVAYEPSQEILKKVADLLGDDHPYLTERGELCGLFDRFLEQFLAAEHFPYLRGPELGALPAGKEILGLSKRRCEAILFVALMEYGVIAKGYDEKVHLIRANGYLEVFLSFLPRDPDTPEPLLKALVELQIESIGEQSEDTLGAISRTLLILGVRRGLSPALRRCAERLDRASTMVAYRDASWSYFLPSARALAYLRDEVPSPEEFLAVPKDVEDQLELYLAEARAEEEGGEDAVRPKQVPAGRHILGLERPERAEFVLPVMRRLLLSVWCREEGGSTALIAIARPLLRGSPPLDPRTWQVCIALISRLSQTEGIPNADFLGALEAWHKENCMPEEMRHALRRWRDRVKGRWTTQRERGLVDRMGRLIGGMRDEPAFEKGPWGRRAQMWLQGLSEAEQVAWRAILIEAKAAGETAKPSAKWCKAMTAAIDQVGQERYREQVVAWLEDFPLTPGKPEHNTNRVKGLVWGLGLVGKNPDGYHLGKFARRAFAKVPGYGPGSNKLGNAAVLALGRLKGKEGIIQLTGLRARVRYPSVRRTVDKALEEAAEREGIGAEEIEELAVPSLGLGPEGLRLVSVGDFQAELAITGSNTAELRWITPKGKRQKTVPKAVKEDFAGQLKELKRDLKELRDSLRIQCLRLESLLVAERRWTYRAWRERYDEQPLISALCRHLIWRFEIEGEARCAMPTAEGLRTVEGDLLHLDKEATEVALWHPIDSTVAEVRAWRARLSALEITQPFKQAHREIYVLTEAERQTATYSNRFASHVIRQHQFRALCQSRDWQYELQGSWDSHNTPTRTLPTGELSARFVVDAPEYDREDPDQWNEEGASGFPFLTTDRVQFVDAVHVPVRLERVPRRLFSELMRDVDLFVSLTSVGNNPEWHDGGPNGRFGAYWMSYAFGELDAFAETRREVLADLLPKLKIAEQLELGERYLVVRGRLRTYKIHLRSANILMEPNDQYLCIVVGRSQPKARQAICLPFEGDPVVSLILSKALLLAADDKIKDPVIVSQIRQ